MKNVLAVILMAGLTGVASAAPPNEAAPKPGTATEASYEALRFGMSLSQVERIAGSKGVVVASGHVAPGEKGVAYEWSGRTMFTKLICKFQDGKLIAKLWN